MEKENADKIAEILLKLTREALFSLASTVTQGFLKDKIRSRKEAIQAILKYSPDTTSILKRKCVTRDILFDYLHENDVAITLPATKPFLIKKICKYWNLDIEEEDDDVESQEDAVNIRQNFNVGQDIQTSKTDSQIDAMAEKFAEWFYSMLNQNEAIGDEHFWSDAKLTLNLISDTQRVTENCENSPSGIAELLFKTKCKHELYFNPNLSKEGVRGRMDSHGLVIVLACGTLHTNNTCVGVFEQMFGLARDPFCENNWKIKTSELNLRSKTSVNEAPKLCDNELTSELLSVEN